MSTIAERVAAGAAFLDERDPDWWRADVERAINGCYCAGNKGAYQAHLDRGEEPCGRSTAARKASDLAIARNAEGRQP